MNYSLPKKKKKNKNYAITYFSEKVITVNLKKKKNFLLKNAGLLLLLFKEEVHKLSLPYWVILRT